MLIQCEGVKDGKFSIVISEFHGIGVIIISIEWKLLLQVNHCKTSLVTILLRIDRMPHVGRALVASMQEELAMFCSQQIKYENDYFVTKSVGGL